MVNGDDNRVIILDYDIRMMINWDEDPEDAQDDAHAQDAEDAGMLMLRMMLRMLMLMLMLRMLRMLMMLLNRDASILLLQIIAKYKH